MSKIEELIESIRNKNTGYDTQDFLDYSIERIMQEYAEYYAKKCLEIASNEARPKPEYFEGEIWYGVDSKTITNIKLPDHE